MDTAMHMGGGCGVAAWKLASEGANRGAAAKLPLRRFRLRTDTHITIPTLTPVLHLSKTSDSKSSRPMLS